MQISEQMKEPNSDALVGSNSSNDSIICNVLDYQRLAKNKLSLGLYEYIASGTDDEQTLSENRSAFKTWYLRPRVMRAVSRLNTETHILGQRLSMPAFISPLAAMCLCDPVHGECAAAKACGRVGTIFTLSQHSTKSIEQVATAAPETNCWYQSYILSDRELTLRLVRRAAQAGYKGIFLTVDSVRFGYREADARNGWNALPAPHRLVNYDEPSSPFTPEGDYGANTKKSWGRDIMIENNATWADIRWLKEEGCRGLPLVVKGVMTAEDALLAIDSGADGIMVSNHGGRSLDGALASIDALPEVVEAVDGRVPVLLDGGVTRGSDILKALALGATAVGVGRPALFALSVGGEDAVLKLLGMLKAETEAAMAICGCCSLKDITPRLVTRHPRGGPVVPYVRSSL